MRRNAWCIGMLAGLLAACGSDTTQGGQDMSGNAGGDMTVATADMAVATADMVPACGPPPSGFSLVVPDPGKKGVGLHTSLALDEMNDPLIAYDSIAPGGDAMASVLYFTRWGRCEGKWLSPIMVDTVHDVIGNGDHQVTIAYDASTKTLGIAYIKVLPQGTVGGGNGPNGTPATWLATSTDNGKTWSTQQVSKHDPNAQGDIQATENPALAMVGGKVYIVYAQGNVQCDAETTCNSTWFVDFTTPASATRTLIPYAGSAIHSRTSAPNKIAVDSGGTPALALFAAPPTAYNTTLVYWRMGMTAAVKVTDSMNNQNDGPTTRLAFDGLKPRITAMLTQPKESGAPLFIASDDGMTWGARTLLPDGINSGELAMSIDASHRIVIATELGGNTQGDATCGKPRTMVSTNASTFAPCGLNGIPTSEHRAVGFLGSVMGSDGKLSLAFYEGTDPGEASTDDGVTYWREP